MKKILIVLGLLFIGGNLVADDFTAQQIKAIKPHSIAFNHTTRLIQNKIILAAENGVHNIKALFSKNIYILSEQREYNET